MRRFLKLILLSSIAISTACSKQEVQWKQVVMDNLDRDVIELKSFTGIDMFGGVGPADFGGTNLFYRTSKTLMARVDLKVNYPITVVFRKKGSSDNYTEQKITKIQNLDKTLIDHEAAILVLFRDGEFKLFYYPGDVYIEREFIDKNFPN